MRCSMTRVIELRLFVTEEYFTVLEPRHRVQGFDDLYLDGAGHVLGLEQVQ